MDNFLKNFLDEYRIKDEDNTILLRPTEDDYEQREFKYFSYNSTEGKEGIKILYPTLEQSIYTVTNKAGYKKNFYRIRLENPVKNTEGKIMKYLSPPRYVGDEDMMPPFFPPDIIQAYQNGDKIKDLYITEGEKKAFAASKTGIFCVGLGSKDGFMYEKTKENRSLHYDIIKLINKCQIENICLILDADTLSIKESHLEKNKDLKDRAYSFFRTAINYKNIVAKAMRESQTLQNGFFGFIKPDFNTYTTKGLDDLINHFYANKNDIVIDIRHLDKASEYFQIFDIISHNESKIRDIFGIGYEENSIKRVENFYNVYSKGLAKRNFCFEKKAYFWNEDTGKYDAVQSLITNGTVSYDMIEYCSTVAKGSKNFSTITDGFLIFIKYFTEDEYERFTWILELRHKEKENQYIEVTNDEFHEARKMEKKFTSKLYPLNLTDITLKEMRNFLISTPEISFSKAMRILRYGYEENTELFLFGNAAISKKGEVIYPDQFGIISYNSQNISIPTLSKKNNNLYYFSEYRYSFNEWYSLLSTAQREDIAFISASWLINTIFRDIAIENCGFSPILFITGIAGTAKSTIFRHMNYLFTQDAKDLEINIKGKNTNAAFTAKIEQRNNGFLFADEYYPNHPLEDAFQASYDNKGYSKMDSSNSGMLETIDMIPKCAIGIASNFKPKLPESEPFFTRLVLLINNDREFSNSRKAAFENLKKIQEKGLSSIVQELWKNRDLIKSKYSATYKHLAKSIQDKIDQSESITSRLIYNLASTITPAYILHTESKIQICEFTDKEDVLNYFVDSALISIMYSHRIMTDKSVLKEFFEILQSLFDKGALEPTYTYRFLEEDIILLNLRVLYRLYAEIFRKNVRFELDAPSLSEIEDLIMTFAGKDTSNEEERKKFFTKQRMGERASHGCVKLNYTKLQDAFGIDFMRGRWEEVRGEKS